MPYRLGPWKKVDPEAGAIAPEGDGFAAAGELVTLVVEPGVQTWLELSGAEKREAAEVAATYRQAVKRAYAAGPWLPPHRHPGVAEARREAEATLGAIFGPARQRRLRQLSRRLRGSDALLDDDVAEALGLGLEQREALREALDRQEGAPGPLGEISAARLASPADLEARARRHQDGGAQRLLELLTPEQRAAFERLQEAS